MDFTHTETQKEYQEKARRLAVECLAPKYQEREKRGFVEKDLQIEMGKLGLIAPEIPEDLGAALGWVAELSEGPPLALGVAKRVVDQGIQADLRTGLELEAQGIALLFGTEDQVEGMSVFLEKREAKCTGE